MIRLALIGCGGFGKSQARALAEVKSRAVVVATADLQIERAQAAAAELGCARAVSDYREIFDQIDAAVVAAPHFAHHSISRDLLEAGKHVLVEKPLALSEDLCLDLIRLERASGCILMVGYCMRYHPLVNEMERLIRAKAHGDLFQLSIWTEQHTQGGPDSWRNRKETLGGGQLFSHGCHYIDILLHWLGEPVEGTHTGNRLGTPWMEGEGTSNVVIRFASDVLGYHFGTWGARGTRLKYSFHAHCTEGMLEAQVTQGRLILHQDAREEAAGREQVLFEIDPGKHLPNELAHFIDCVESGKRPLTSAADSLHSLRVIWKLYEAEEAGRVADLRGLKYVEG